MIAKNSPENINSQSEFMQIDFWYGLFMTLFIVRKYKKLQYLDMKIQSKGMNI